MTDTILVKGIIQYCHLVKASAPTGTQNYSYNVSLLIPESDTEQCKKITETFDAVIANGFPSGLPQGFKSSWSKVDANASPALAGYMSLKISKPQDAGAPDFVNQNKEPIIDPGADGKVTGQWAYANIWVHTYTQGSNGVKCRPNAVMLTGEEGPIPVGSLSSKPSIDQLFAGIGDISSTPSQPHVSASGTPVTGMAPPPVPTMAPPPVPTMAPPPVPAQPKKVMTDKANGASYDQMVAAGWSEQQMIDNGMMVITSV